MDDPLVVLVGLGVRKGEGAGSRHRARDAGSPQDEAAQLWPRGPQLPAWSPSDGVGGVSLSWMVGAHLLPAWACWAGVCRWFLCGVGSTAPSCSWGEQVLASQCCQLLALGSHVE